MRRLRASERTALAVDIDTVLALAGPDLRQLALEVEANHPGSESWLIEPEHGRRETPELRKLAGMALQVAHGYAPDLEVRRGKRGDGPLYLRRWWLEREETPRGGQRGLYIHEFRNDDAAGLHDHPWPSASLMLAGVLNEHMRSGTRRLTRGTVCVRSARFRHRLTLPRDGDGAIQPTLTLIATGLREKAWELEHGDGEIEVIGGTGAAPAARATAAPPRESL